SDAGSARRRLGRLPGRRGARERGGGGHPPAAQVLRAAHALLPRAPQGPGRGGHPPAAAGDRARGPAGRVVPDPHRGAGRARPAQAAGIPLGRNRPMDGTQDRSNRLSVTRAGGQLITDYWDDLFTARERGKQIVWYNGGALNPFFQAAGLAWCHGEAFAARLAAQRLEGPAQLAGAEYGYNAELCSYARTHLGCSVLTLQSTEGERSGVVGINDSRELAARLPSPDFFVNNYAGCSTGQQWDGISYRVFGKQLPIFNISHPFLWGNKPDAGYLRGEEWESASRYVAGQLRELISFLEAQTGRPFDYDALSEAMTYIKRAAELRREGLDLCKAKPAPATFWDWIACVAPINFLPGDQALVDYFAGVRDEIAERLKARVSGVRDEKYRLYFDGIMNWNKLGFLSRKFAEHGAAVLCGRYIHNAFWQEPQLIDTADPILGMAQ